MKKDAFLWSLGGFAATSLLGTLLHFLYDLSGQRKWAAIVSGVNESTWEHMKLLFFPMLLFSITAYFFFGSRRDFWCIQLRSILLGQILIPILFYTYNGAIGKSPDWLNISIFFLSALIAFRRHGKLLSRESTPCPFPAAAFALICVLGILFGIFTFYPPRLGIFSDPISGSYGI